MQLSNNKSQELWSFTTNNIWVPAEIFQRILSCMTTTELIETKRSLTSVCKSFYVNTKILFTYKIAYQERIENETNNIINKLKEKMGLLKFIPLKDVTFNANDLVPSVFCHNKDINDIIIFRHFFITRIYVKVFQELIPKNMITVSNLKNSYFEFIQKLLSQITLPSLTKLNCLEFLLNLWDSIGSIDKKVILEACTLVLFSSSKAKCEDFGPHFKAHSWLKDKDTFNCPQLLWLQARAQEIVFKNYNQGLEDTLKAPFAICAGLLCLSSATILQDQRTDALNLLKKIAFDTTHANVWAQIANTIILLDKHTEGGFCSLPDEERMLLKAIFERIKSCKAISIKSKVAEIEKFIYITKRKAKEDPNQNVPKIQKLEDKMDI